MPVIESNAAMTIVEANKRQGYDDDAAVLGELGQENDFLDEVIWQTATHGMHNKQLQANRLGTGGFGHVNGPVTPITSGTTEVLEPVKIYEGDSQVDERLLEGVNDRTVTRDSEDQLNLAGVIQDWIYNVIYPPATVDPDAFKTLVDRRPTLVANRCWSNGGAIAAEQSSCWLFEMSKRGFYLAYPKSLEHGPGLSNEDRGRHFVPVPTGTGNMWAWVRRYKMYGAIVLRDDRALQRMANIDSGVVTAAVKPFDPNVFIKMKNELPSVGRNAVAFVNRTIKAQIDINAYDKTNIKYTLREIQGYGPITMVAAVPIRMMEPLLITEAVVAA